MVKHDIRVRGVDLSGTEQKPPVILQMNDDDFPARFLQDLASPGQPPISSTAIVNTGTQPLYQPVQRMLNVAVADLCCNTLSYPRVDPTRILSAGLVVRRVFRQPGVNGGAAWDDPSTLSAWMRSPSGQFSWRKLTPDQETLDPDPAKRPQLKSGQPELDRQLAALASSTAYTESTTPAFAIPPATSASLCRTVVYAVIPTASSEVSDTRPAQPPNIDPSGLLSSLPALLRSSQYTSAPATPAPAPLVDYRWMSDEFLNTIYAPTSDSFKQFQGFTTALRMLHTVFGAFDGTSQGNAILNLLNQHDVAFGQSPDTTTMPMGEFYQTAKSNLLDYDPYPNATTSTPPQLQMPDSWGSLNDNDQSQLLGALLSALAPRAQSLLAPQGRFQDSTRQYRLRMFFRLKGETSNCPPELVWSHYSEPFRIAPWHATGNRTHPPIPLPDPTSDFVKNAKPNCTFQVPGNLMSAMQSTSMSGLMKGTGGGPSLNLAWICGFNIPLITICAFFVLNIFLSLLNIIFFWLPFIKICIPFPSVSSSQPDEGM